MTTIRTPVPSCAQKRTLLRVFLRHDRDLFADIGRLLFDILMSFFSQAAGRTLRCAMVVSHQTFGEFGVLQQHAYYLPLLSPYARVNSVF